MDLIIGLDGGGTKTAGLLCDAGNRVLARVAGPGTAIVGMPPPHVCETLNGLVDRLCAEAHVSRSRIAHVALGLSGIDFDDEIPEQHRIFSRSFAIAPERCAIGWWKLAARPAAAPSRGRRD